jgi:hypothetical protein
MMISKFQLDYGEVMSILRCQALTPYSNYFLCEQLINMLERANLPLNGFQLGYLIFEKMHKSALDYESTQGKNIPGLRFAKYRCIEHITEKVFIEQTTAMVYHGLCTMQHFSTIKNKAEKAKLYGQVVTRFMAILPNFGLLVCNHFMFIMAILGMVPLWFANEFHGGNDSRGVVFLQKNYGLPRGKDSTKQLLKGMCHAIETKHGEIVCHRSGENIICKSFRLEVGSDGRFTDLVFFGQHIYVVEGDKVRVFFQNGKEVVLDGPLVQFWPYAGGMASASELNQFLLPKLGGSLGSFRMPAELQWTGKITVADNYQSVV